MIKRLRHAPVSKGLYYFIVTILVTYIMFIGLWLIVIPIHDHLMAYNFPVACPRRMCFVPGSHVRFDFN